MGAEGMPVYKSKETKEPCVACNHWGSHKDRDTGLCVECWRVAVLGAWAVTCMTRGAYPKEPSTYLDSGRIWNGGND